MEKGNKKRNAQAVAAWNRKGGAHTKGTKRPDNFDLEAQLCTCEECGEDIDYCECHFDALDDALFGDDDY